MDKTRLLKRQRDAIKRAQTHARRGNEFFAIYFLDMAKKFGPVATRTTNSINRKLKQAERAGSSEPWNQLSA